MSAVLAAAPALGSGQEELIGSFGLSDPPPELARFPRPASRIAENITVVTAQDIARINAHTVAEVLNTLPGVQMDQLQTPGSMNFFGVLGASSRHVLVQIDGVAQNLIGSENIAQVGLIPVQMIERIEVVKGAASAAWGSALGGVINIVTKSPAADRAAGMVSGSTGKSATRDLRAEATGSGERFGYYLTAGKLSSDGLLAGNDTDMNHGFGKLSYDFPNGGDLSLSLDARHSMAGTEESRRYDFHNTGAATHATGNLVLNYPLAERLALEANAHTGRREVQNRRAVLTTGVPFADFKGQETFRGADAALSWGDASRALKAGVSLEETEVEMHEPVRRYPQANYDLALRRESAYLNGTYTMGRLSILPGVRLDRLSLMEDPVSFTLGATLRLTDNTLLRGYAAYGYSMPIISNLGIQNGQVQRDLQHVRTVQAGVESADLPFVWVKTTFFYAEVWNIQDFDQPTPQLSQQVKQGAELELKSSPWCGFALNGSYNFTDARDQKTGKVLSVLDAGPRQALKVGVRYDSEPAGLSATLLGDWAKLHNPGRFAKDKGEFWDLHLTQKLSPSSDNSPELFLSWHNIFDSKRYFYDFRANAPRWLEAGARWFF
ncbi:TonB-dependent receptor plug domain-containing protein [Citrifermentans bemidjiense]|uniref:TonB-dependent receptor plug domain-containing protein n=1 Tax=Citrifermentans bemidjiense TaxID=225194 RepID=UPI0002DE7DE1|nr:TonB-dependent receptor plug domain-containing protein [Citrifermentans bemidjiense]